MVQQITIQNKIAQEKNAQENLHFMIFFRHDSHEHKVNKMANTETKKSFETENCIFNHEPFENYLVTNLIKICVELKKKIG